MTVGVLAAVFVGVIPRFADYASALDTVRALRPLDVLALGLLAVWFLCAYWLVLMAALPSLRFREAGVNHSTGTAVTNTVPAGGALALGFNYSMYLSWGFTPTAVTTGILSAGIFDNFVKWGLPAVAFLLSAAVSGSTGLAWALPTMGVVVLAGALIVLIGVLRSDVLAMRVGRALDRVSGPVFKLLRRPAMALEQQTLAFRRSMVGLWRRRWAVLTVATLGNHLAMFAVLLASLRMVGVGDSELSLLTVLSGFSVARLLSAVPITPGGVGLVDAGYVAILSLGVDAVTRPAVVAGVLLFRALTFFPPIPVGLGSWLFWRSNDSWRQAPDDVPRGEL